MRFFPFIGNFSFVLIASQSGIVDQAEIGRFGPQDIQGFFNSRPASRSRNKFDQRFAIPVLRRTHQAPTSSLAHR